jgi:manganese/zinc/iron transport system ATP- binding protein
MKANSLEVHDLTVAYQHNPVLWNINFNVPSGKLTGIIGPNGAGKSTLLKAIMELTPISGGHTKLFDKALEDVRARVAYVPQKDAVDWDFPATVLEVVQMGRYGNKSLFSRLSKKDEDIAVDCLSKVEMLDYSDRHISELSGGQKQRVFIARALAQEADLYFMDEPFAGIDAASEKQIIDILLKMQQEGKSIFVVHHDLQSAIDYFDWIILVNTRLIAAGPTKETFTPENLKETYGGKLTLLSKLGQELKSKQFPVREEHQ